MVKIKNIDYIDLILKTLVVVFGAIAAYWIILKIIGRSPDLSEINLILIVMLITATTNFYYKFGEFKGKMEEFRHNTKESFSRVKDDLIQAKNDIINEIKRGK